jgi:hypothetical protein
MLNPLLETNLSLIPSDPLISRFKSLKILGKVILYKTLENGEIKNEQKFIIISKQKRERLDYGNTTSCPVITGK